jgi:hypothetical protein
MATSLNTTMLMYMHTGRALIWSHSAWLSCSNSPLASFVQTCSSTSTHAHIHTYKTLREQSAYKHTHLHPHMYTYILTKVSGSTQPTSSILCDKHTELHRPLYGLPVDTQAQLTYYILNYTQTHTPFAGFVVFMPAGTQGTSYIQTYWSTHTHTFAGLVGLVPAGTQGAVHTQAGPLFWPRQARPHSLNNVQIKLLKGQTSTLLKICHSKAVKHSHTLTLPCTSFLSTDAQCKIDFLP